MPTTHMETARPETRPPPANKVYSDSDGTSNNIESSDEQEFDWDLDDEAISHSTITLTRAKRGRRVWMAFMKLSRPARVFLVAVLGVAVLITPLLVVNTRFRQSPAKIQVHVWSLWFTTIWAASCGTYVLVDAIPYLVLALISLFGGQVERLKIQFELVMAVKGWLKLTLDTVWAWVALSVIRAIYNPPLTYWTTINQIMQALFSAGLILLIEKLCLHFIAINFHQQALADRLDENQRGLRALDHLSRSPYTRKERKTQPISASNTELFSGVGHKPTQSVVSLPNEQEIPLSKKKAKKTVAAVIVDQVGEAIGQVALKNSKFNKDVDPVGLHSARRLARKLFSALSDVNPPRSHLIVEDFYPHFRSTSEAHEAFEIFDKDRNGDISKKEMREAVQRIYRERKSLVSGLKDVDSIVAKLDAVLMAAALLVILFVCLLIFQRNNTLSSLVPLATVVLGFSFIFGNSAQTLFESLIFIFSTHVFDVGDLVMIDDQVLFVKEFGMFSTTFRRVDGQEIIAPNSLLSKEKLIHNLRRSKAMWESTTLMVSYNTPIELIEALKGEIAEYIALNSREWSDFALNISKMDYQNSIHLTVAIEHRSNWQDWGARWSRRNAFMRHLKTILEDLDINYTMPVQPILLPPANGRPLTAWPAALSPSSASGLAYGFGNNSFSKGGPFP